MKDFTRQLQAAAFTAAVLASTSAYAQVDTGASAMQKIQTWMMTWVPIAATVLIIVCAILWIGNVMRADWAVRVVIGLVVIGSASYLVGLFLPTGG